LTDRNTQTHIERGRERDSKNLRGSRERIDRQKHTNAQRDRQRERERIDRQKHTNAQRERERETHIKTERGAERE